ncbi:hypothetical protein MUK42_03138 [Musa troglodytarum]|uniref:Uncharacterized protein n=2 Tax=Musa troglodytarum TaxID=320322 RepID=A0A9E7H293_9LILI|nr:hypothetical protein MUK42_03138 [Musa troglodytarum]
MNGLRVNSSPHLIPPSGVDHPNESTLEENVKTLLRLIHDYTEGGGYRPQCVTGMMTVLDDLKSQVQKLQPPRRGEAELRRCNTDLRRGAPPREKKPLDPAADEVQKLRRELFAHMTARKNLERMFSSLGKEKEIMAAELTRKARELAEAEELVDDLRAQNEVLLEKVKACASEHKKNGSQSRLNSVLQERNKTLSEQLLKSLDAYRTVKRRLRDVQEENARIVLEAAEVAAASAGIVRRVRGRMEGGGNGKVRTEEEINSLEQMLHGLQGKLRKVSPNKGDCRNSNLQV